MLKLIQELDALFPKKQIHLKRVYFTINRHGDGSFRFEILHNFGVWSSKGLKTDFNGSTIEESVTSFLDYVKEQNINVDLLSKKEM